MFGKIFDDVKHISKGMISKLSHGVKMVKTMFTKLNTHYPAVSHVLDTLVSSSETASGVKKAFNFISSAIETLDTNYKSGNKSGNKVGKSVSELLNTKPNIKLE